MWVAAGAKTPCASHRAADCPVGVCRTWGPPAQITGLCTCSDLEPTSQWSARSGLCCALTVQTRQPLGLAGALVPHFFSRLDSCRVSRSVTGSGRPRVGSVLSSSPKARWRSGRLSSPEPGGSDPPEPWAGSDAPSRVLSVVL